MKLEDIRELIKLIDETSIDEFEFEKDGEKVLIKKRAEQTVQMVQPSHAEPVQQPVHVAPPVQEAPGQKEAPQNESAQSEDNSTLHKIVSPMVGTFYGASSPDADNFVKVGSKVNQDTVVCIVEAMKLFNEIEADVKGVIAEVLVENGQLVEYGQPLFLVKAE